MMNSPLYPTDRSYIEHLGIGCNLYANIDWANRIRKTAYRVAAAQGKKFRTRSDRGRKVIIVTRIE